MTASDDSACVLVNDPYDRHDSMGVSYNPSDRFVAYGQTLPIAVPLSRIGGSAPEDPAGWFADMDGCFGGLTFTVTAYFTQGTMGTPTTHPQ